MIEKRILIVEDEPISAKLMHDLLVKNGFIITSAPNGKEALTLFNENPYPVVITDIDMPVMNGKELISHLKKGPGDPMILVETVNDETSDIIEIMKYGVYDYMIKPIVFDDLLLKVRRAFEVAELKRAKAIAEKEKIIRLKSQLAVLTPKTEGGVPEPENREQSLTYRLHTIFNQGAGFGTLISAIEFFMSFARKEGDNYIIQSDFVNMVNVNLEIAKKGLMIIKEIDYINSSSINFEKISFNDFISIVTEQIKSADKAATIKNQKINTNILYNFESDKSIRLNKSYFTNAFLEILINACKFSPDNVNIIVNLDIDKDVIIISTINKPLPDQDERIGIPMEYENIIFEPFFRLSKLVWDQYESIDYGLGLTLVDCIIRKHNGSVSLSNIELPVSTSQPPEVFVSATISLPISDSE